jgi:hypothetical protein
LAPFSACRPRDGKNSQAKAENNEIIWIVRPIVTTEEIMEQINKIGIPLPLPTLGLSGNVVLDKIVNLGKTVWDIIEGSKPSADLSWGYANALPKGVGGGDQLEGFSDTQHNSFSFQGKNAFGEEVWSMTVTLVHKFGGKYNGKGAFIDGAAAIPSKVKVAAGYNTFFKAEKVSVTNVGSAGSPVAQLVISVNFGVNSPLVSSQKTKLAVFRGDNKKADLKDH